MIETWRKLRLLLSRSSRMSAMIVVFESLAASLLEGMLLVLVVTAALAVAAGNSAVGLDLPLYGQLGLQVEKAILISGGAGAVSLLLHIHTADRAAALSAEVLKTARQRAIEAFTQASWAHQSQEREGALQESLGTLALQASALTVYCIQYIAASVSLAALFVTALVVNPAVTLIVLPLGGGLFLALRPMGRLTRKRADEFVAENLSFSERVAQWNSLAMDLRVFGVAEVEADRLRSENVATAALMKRTRFVASVGGTMYRDVSILFLVISVGALGLVSRVELATVGAVVMLIVRSLGYAQQTQTAVHQVHERAPNLAILLRRIAALEEALVPVGITEIAEVAPVELHGVSYEYQAGDGLTLDAISLCVERGEILGIVGPSGGGKSTLVELLMRLRTPTHGSITAAGTSYDDVSSACWHRLTALVPQEPRLLQGTIAENITFFRSGFSQADIENAAIAAHLLDEVQRLPQGLDTELGPRGAGLSGGQKQRLVIARALLGSPHLLVLDEPTSALDVRSEELLQATIAKLKGQMTIVIVAHRAATLAACDRVVAMKAGRVAAVGTLEEALASVRETRAETGTPERVWP